MVTKNSHRRVRLLMAALLALMLPALLGAPQAFAHNNESRSGLVVKLISGQVVTLLTEMQTPLSNVRSVEYVLHAGPGLSVVEVTHPFPRSSSLESFTFADDEAVDKFRATTFVTLRSGKKVKVEANLAVATPGKKRVKTDRKRGHNNELLTTQVNVPLPPLKPDEKE